MSVRRGLRFSYPLFFSLKKLKKLDYYIYLYGWYILQAPVLLAEHFFSCIIYGGSIARLDIENHSETLKQLEVEVVRVQVVMSVISKIKERIRNLTIRLPSFPSGFLSLALEARGVVGQEPNYPVFCAGISVTCAGIH